MKPNPSDLLKIYNSGADTLSLEDIWYDLEQIARIKKCSFCGCNADALREFAAFATRKGRFDLAGKANSLQKEISQRKRYECISCNPCYPADISNLLFELSDESPSKNEKRVSCSCSSEKSCHWPVEKGEYFVGDEKSPVAVCTLANAQLPEQIHTAMGDKVAITGYCETENIGIEKVIKNIISNVHIRYLILCGDESGSGMMGHLSGQAILALYENGISEKGRIIGAKGKRPVLKNITSEQVKRFQSQITLINRIGSNTLNELMDVIENCLSANTPQFKEKITSISSNNLIVSHNPQRLVLDKKGFFVIIPQKDEDKIYVEYYANSGKLLHTIVGTDAPSIYYTIIERGFISKLDHAAYLGKELTKAEYFLKYDIPYRQDKALGELVVEHST